MIYISEKYQNPLKFKKEYKNNSPFPHIVFDNFINKEILDQVEKEFPDLSTIKNKIEFKQQKQIKFASKGFADLSLTAKNLIGYLNSNLFLEYLQNLTGINEKLISDPYLSGGGYHEIKRGGLLKVHADFNKHPHLNLDRRLNLLLYLNKNWDSSWGGDLELFDNGDLSKAAKTVPPLFNRCLIFTTTSFTYHGHPNKLMCPESKSRKSIALYYFSIGRPKSEISRKEHSTIFVETKEERFRLEFKEILIEWIPPALLRGLKVLKKRILKR